MKEIGLSVHGLVDFLLRSGNIDNRIFNNASMAEGSRIHLRYQQIQNNNYLSEQELSCEVIVDDFKFILSGRADGIIIGKKNPIIDEIKSTVIELEKFYEENKDWQVGLSVSPTGSFQQVSYVNCVNTFDGGTHNDHILNQIIPSLREKISKKFKTDIMPGQIKNHIFLFINSTIINPAFSSQTKEKLITDIKNFGTEIKLTDKFINSIYKSEITNSITDWLDQKKAADEKKAEREANKAIAKVKVEKLIDCKFAGGSKKHLTSLAITEGLSASAGFRKFRNANTQALFPIRGKILNVRVTTNDKDRSNEELKGIMAAMGLQFGKSPFVYSNGKIIQDNLRIHEVHILTDADTDGDDIAGLLLNIFAYYWPELIKEHRIARIETPILIAKCGKKSEKFYHKSEFDEWCVKNDIKKWNIEYYKGLGSLEDCDYKDIIQNPNVYYYEWDDLANEELDIWFGKDADKRKDKLS